VVTPLEHAPFYSEHLAQMPVCYQPNDRQRALPPAPTRAAAGLPEDAVVLAGFNQPYKISAEVFDVWCVLLDALPQALLWLLEWNAQSRENLEREAVTRGIDPARIVWAPRLRPADHMARMQLADLFLDTWPCNAHTTASDALWAGVPVVTFTGRTFASRVAASLVHAWACRSWPATTSGTTRARWSSWPRPRAPGPPAGHAGAGAHGVAAVRQPALRARLRGAGAAHDAAPRARAAGGSPCSPGLAAA
jgi:predicted O-linked N-acetylglucosamine transferase (SPINDLY family)